MRRTAQAVSLHDGQVRSTKKGRVSVIRKALSVFFTLALLLPLMAGALVTTSGAYDYIAYGIDVSKWQGTINWDSVKAAGVDFVIIKVGSTKGMDEYFEFNYLGAKSRGINVGAYYYTYAMNQAEAAAEAETVASWLAGKTFEYPIYFDIEDPSQEALSVEARTNMCIAFNSTLESKGYFAGIYSSKSWLNSYLDKATLSNKYAIWEASWRLSGQADIDKSADCQMWQYSATGRVSGISGDVDMDVSYVNYPEVIRKVGLNGFSKGSVDSTVCAYYTTTASTLNIRSGPDTSYGIVDFASYGAKVILLDVNANGTWAKVFYNGKIGWLSDKYLTLSSPVPFEYTVSYDAGLDGVEAPKAVKLSYGATMTTAALSDTQTYTFKGWNLKRVSDNSWYTEKDGWIADTEISAYEKAIIGTGKSLALDESFVVFEAGSDSYILYGVWEKSFKYGDANGDGNVNARDMIAIKKYISGQSVAVNVTAIDLDGDGGVRSRDSLLLKKYLGSSISSFPVEQQS